MYHRYTAAATLLLLLLGPRTPLAALDLRRQYEDELVRWALGVAHLELDPAPRGKIIERIEIVREDIIARSDPWPRLLNWVHVTTKDHVVRQELLLRPGQRWDQELVDESARNLRKLPILAVVRTAACRSPEPGKVILLVVTKDLWSIRLNTVFNMVGSVLHVLSFNPSEMNFLGRNKRVSLHVGLSELDLGPFKVRDCIELGQLYYDDRLLGSRVQLTEYFEAVINGELPAGAGLSPAGQRWSPPGKLGDLEGVYAQLRLSRPLFSLATAWGFDVSATANLRQVRRYVVNSSSPPPGEDAGLSLDTVAVSGAEGTSYVPWVFDERELTASASLTRSFGGVVKHDVTSTLAAYGLRYAPPDDLPFDAAVIRTYRRRALPRSEDVAYYSIGYHTYRARYVQLRNIQTFALTEDFALGHDVTAAVRFAANLDDATQGFLRATLDATYRWYLRDDLLTAWISLGTRWQPRLGRVAGGDRCDPNTLCGPWANSTLGGGVRNVSPRLWVGRLHTQVGLTLRENSLDNVSSSLGGDTGLRGYASNQFRGENLFQVNVEYRSLAINLFTLHVGFVLFYDGGAVWGRDPRNPDTDLPFRYHQGVGLGLRTHFPQFDRASLRVDFGVPLSGEAGGVGTWFSFAFAQVF